MPSNRGGGQLIIFKGFTFVNVYNQIRWHCSKRLAGCKVKMSTTSTGQLVEVTGEHNHPPPNIFRSPNGKMYKV